LFITISSNAQDFRKVNWGATKSTVKKSETAKLAVDNADGLVYETALFNLDCLLRYEFVDGILCRAAYMTKSNTSEASFAYVLSKMEEKYGKAQIGKTNPGELKKYFWNNAKTGIELTYVFYESNGKGGYFIQIWYTSEKYRNKLINKSQSDY
ncbi:MAG: hypothetical protein ACXWDO_06330, partial [Bacteroidia bacterium]